MLLFDENGNRYNIKEKIGEGGQGAVWNVANNDSIVIKTKILPQFESDSGPENNENFILCDEVMYDKYAKKIKKIMAMVNLARIDNIAAPITMLKKPQCGYVMRFMSDMECIKNQMRFTDNNCISYVNSNHSIEKKMKVLMKLSKILVDLNKSGLVYCDMSPGNVFVSKSPESHEVWLIDLDNLHYHGESRTVIGTPNYRAPEIADQTAKQNTFQSDIYSFALIAFEYLTGTSPFDGTYMETNEDDFSAWDECEEEWGEDSYTDESAAENGNVPYIYENKGNDFIRVIPKEFVFTPAIEKLFFRTFSEQGRKNPHSRPTAGEWYEAFEEACDLIGLCSNGHVHIGTTCKWCEMMRMENKNTYFSISVESCPEDSAEQWDSTEVPAIHEYVDYNKVIYRNHMVEYRNHEFVEAAQYCRNFNSSSEVINCENCSKRDVVSDLNKGSSSHCRSFLPVDTNKSCNSCVLKDGSNELCKDCKTPHETQNYFKISKGAFDNKKNLLSIVVKNKTIAVEMAGELSFEKEWKYNEDDLDRLFEIKDNGTKKIVTIHMENKI